MGAFLVCLQAHRKTLPTLTALTQPTQFLKRRSLGYRCRYRDRRIVLDENAHRDRAGDMLGHALIAQIIEVQVVVPKPEDERVRNLLKELSKLDPEDPRSELFAKAVV